MYLEGLLSHLNNVASIYSDSLRLWYADSITYNTLFKYFRLDPLNSYIYDTRGAINDFNLALKGDSNYAFAYYNRFYGL